MSDAVLNTVFYTNLGISVAAYAAIFAGAPYIADFYSQPELAVLGFVRKVCSQATVYARQAYHGPEAAGQLVVSRADPAQLFDPSETALDDVPVAIPRFVKAPRRTRAWLSLHLALGNDRLHSVPVAVAA